MRVLVVEDERYLAEAIHAKLSLEAISADIADDGAAALEAVAHTEYDVVLLDRDIPVIHGDEVSPAPFARPRSTGHPDAHRCSTAGRQGRRSHAGSG